MALNGPQQHDM